MRKKGSPDRIASWARNQAANPTSTFELRCELLGAGSVVATWAREDVVESPDLWAESVMTAAQGDADDRESDTRYALVHCRDGRDYSTHVIRCKAATDDDRVALTGDAAGVIAQLMRHLEAVQRLLVQSQASVVNSQQTLIEAQGKRILALEAERSGLVDVATRSAGVDPEDAERKKRLAEVLDVAVQVAMPHVIGMLMPPEAAEAAAEAVTDGVS